jgi:hypothetical protein
VRRALECQPSAEQLPKRQAAKAQRLARKNGEDVSRRVAEPAEQKRTTENSLSRLLRMLCVSATLREKFPILSLGLRAQVMKDVSHSDTAAQRKKR